MRSTFRGKKAIANTASGMPDWALQADRRRNSNAVADGGSTTAHTPQIQDIPLKKLIERGVPLSLIKAKPSIKEGEGTLSTL